MSQAGAYVLKECVNCGAAYPVMNHPMAIKRSMYCPDCKRCRHVDYQREYKNRGSMKPRLAEKAGLPVPKIEVRDGKIIESRGTVTVASWARGRYYERYN